MEVSTAAQPSSGHQKRYVPIVAGTLGGCGLALIIGCLFCLFLRRRRRGYGLGVPLGVPVRPEWLEPQAYRPRLENDTFHTPLRVRQRGALMKSFSHGGHGNYGGGNQIPDWLLHHSHMPEVPELDPESGSPFNIDLETGHPWDWDSNLDLSGLGALPFANVDLETSFDLDHQTSNVSIVQASSDLEPSCNEEFPLDIGLGVVNSVDGHSDVYLSGSRALPFVNPDLQTNLDLDHQDPNTFAVPAYLDLGPNHGTDSFVGINNPDRTSQQGMGSMSLPAPLTRTTISSSCQPLSPLRTNFVPSISSSQAQAPPKPESLPLPPAPTLRCPNCPRKFSSRVRLE